MLAANRNIRQIKAVMSSAKIANLNAPPPMRSHSPIHSKVKVPCRVKRKYAIVTSNKPIFRGVKKPLAAIAIQLPNIKVIDCYIFILTGEASFNKIPEIEF